MQWFHDTVAAFGSQLGLHALEPPGQEVLQLVFESGVLLSIEAAADTDPPQALVFMERNAGFPPEPVARSAMARAHTLHGDPYPVQVTLRSCRGDWRLLALVRIPRRQFTVDRLAHVVERLHRWLDEALRPEGSHV